MNGGSTNSQSLQRNLDDTFGHLERALSMLDTMENVFGVGQNQPDAPPEATPPGLMAKARIMAAKSLTLSSRIERLLAAVMT